MIKTSSLIKITAVLCLIIFLFVPIKIIQWICISVDFMILLSFVYAKTIYRNIDVERNVINLKVASKEQIDVSFSVLNKSVLPVPLLHVSDTVSLYVYGNKNSEVLSLRSRERASVKYTILAKDRGLYYTGHVKITSADPLGLFKIEKIVDVQNTILVRPARLKMTGKLIPGRPQGNLKISNICFEDVTMRRSIREYRTGDELKRINWRMSAKFNSLFTNEYENTFEVPVFIFLNLAEEDYSLDLRHYKIEKAIEIAAYLTENARRLNQPCGFAAYGTDFPFLSPKMNQTDCILDILSLIQFVPGKMDYKPEERFIHQLSKETLFYSVGPDAVDRYIDFENAQQSNFSVEKLKMEKAL